MWQSFIQGFSEFINLIYTFTVQIGFPSYGLAIIFITIIIKLIMFPLTQKQMRSMRAMQEIQPKTKWIQEKYKDDPQVMQTKTMELYKEHGVNPMGGCLPLLVQMPIFIAFYQSLYNFNYLNAAHKGFLWIPDISLPDPYYILAILTAVTTYLQQKISMVSNSDPSQQATMKVMLYMMPLMMAWICMRLPAGLPLYWVVFNILGILQQLYVNYIHKKAQLDTGVGIQVGVPAELVQPDKENDSTEEMVTRKDKGGSESNARPINRKKRKKR